MLEKIEVTKRQRVAVYTGTRNLYEYMCPAVTSMVLNTNVDKIYLLIEDDVFPYWLPDKVETINVSNQPYFDKDGPNFNSPWTYMTLMKVALPLVFFGMYDRILSLDVDTIVDKNIDDLWDMPIDDCYFGAVIEKHRSTEKKKYFNAGMLLLNCEKLIKDGMCDKLINSINKYVYSYNEQDCINYLCEGQIYSIPSDYNVTVFNEIPKEVKLIHYAAIKNWQKEPYFQKYLKEYNKLVEEGVCLE